MQSRTASLPPLPARALLVVALAGAACAPPQPPSPERRPEPQATQLQDAMQAPLEQARAVEDAVREADERRRAELDL